MIKARHKTQWDLFFSVLMRESIIVVDMLTTEWLRFKHRKGRNSTGAGLAVISCLVSISGFVYPIPQVKPLFPPQFWSHMLRCLDRTWLRQTPAESLQRSAYEIGWLTSKQHITRHHAWLNVIHASATQEERRRKQMWKQSDAFSLSSLKPWSTVALPLFAHIHFYSSWELIWNFSSLNALTSALVGCCFLLWSYIPGIVWNCKLQHWIKLVSKGLTLSIKISSLYNKSLKLYKKMLIFELKLQLSVLAQNGPSVPTESISKG